MTEGVAEGPRGWGAPLHARVLDAAGVAPGTRVLDLGCGWGSSPGRAAERGARVTGLDADPAAVAAAAAAVPAGSFLVGDAHDPPPRAVRRGGRRAAARARGQPGGRAAGGGAGGRGGRGDGVGPRAGVRRAGVRRGAGAVAAAPPGPPVAPARRRSPSRPGCGSWSSWPGCGSSGWTRWSARSTTPTRTRCSGRCWPRVSAGPRRTGPVAGAVRDAVLARLAAHRTPAGGYRLHNLFRVLLARRR